MINLKRIFILLVIFSLLALLQMLFPDSGILQGPSILVLWILHALAGLALVITTYREKISGKAKRFLLIAGFSAIGFLTGVVLHNLFYALNTLTELAVLNAILGFFEGAFFLLAVILCPLGLLVGIVGTFIMWKQIPSGKAD